MNRTRTSFLIALVFMLCTAGPSLRLFAQTPTPDQTKPGQETPTADAAEQQKKLNAIIAVVNQTPITYGQLEKDIAPLVPRINQEVGDFAEANHLSNEQASALFDQKIHSIKQQALENKIDRMLIIQDFYDKKYEVPAPFLDKQADDDLTNNFDGDREKFLQYLKANGMSNSDYRKNLKEKIIVDYMGQQFRDSVNGISPQRILDYYNQNKKQYNEEEAVHLRQITLKPLADDSQDIRMQQARSIVDQARQPNADFADLARRFSNDEYAKTGGDAGWIPRQKYEKSLEDVAFKLEPGQVSDPVALGGNVYIFKCEEKRPGGLQPLENVRSQIENALALADFTDAIQKWQKKLRDKAYVVIYMDFSKFGAPDATATR